MNPSDEELEHLLVEADETAIYDLPRLDQLFLQLHFVSQLVAEAGQPLTEPSLLGRQADGRLIFRPIGTGISFGRAPSCDLSYPDLQAVSRLHFEIRPETGDFLLIDPGSANGTFISGGRERCIRHRLRDGDIIEAAGLVFAFVLP